MHNDNVDRDTPEEEQQAIDTAHDERAEMITEVDEAALAAEGMNNRDDHPLSEDVASDRDATPPEALDIPEENIIR
jgi:hypothetical protein